MTKEIRLGVITEDAPVSEEQLAFGMSRVNVRLFRGLLDYITLIAINNPWHSYRHQDFAVGFQDKCILVELPRLWLVVARRLLPQFQRDRTNAIFRFRLPSLVRQLHQRSTNWLFCPCGVDPSGLGRGVDLSQASELPLAVYLVDDFLTGAILSGNQTHLHLAQHNVPRWLSQVDQIFVITEGLRHRLQELYNLDAVVLPIPYDLQMPLTEPIKPQIIFVGNPSHFYVDGLRQIAAIIDDLNREKNLSLTLRLTIADNGSVKSWLGEFDCIHCSPCLGSAALQQEIAASLMCFAPYSFDPKYQDMVASSFPSKMMDYLASGRFILTYGPTYASSVLYFQQHGLSTAVSTEDPATLRQIILQQIYEPKDFSNQYRQVVQKYHASQQIAEQILATCQSQNLGNVCVSK